MTTVFAGFWVNSSVRKPVAGVHTCTDFVACKSSLESSAVRLYSINQLPDGWYWLDTTERKELTPEELHATIKITIPDLSHIIKTVTPSQFGVVCNKAKENSYVTVTWGDMTEYPSQKKWIKVTKDNVIKYMFKPCRYGYHDNVKRDWLTGTIAGWNTKINCCLIASEGDMVGAESVEVVEE